MNTNINNPVPCAYCRYYPVRSRTREVSRSKTHVMLEHQYVCPKCQNLVRTDRENKELNHGNE